MRGKKQQEVLVGSGAGPFPIIHRNERMRDKGKPFRGGSIRRKGKGEDASAKYQETLLGEEREAPAGAMTKASSRRRQTKRQHKKIRTLAETSESSRGEPRERFGEDIDRDP